jgi:hypothetical protein
MNLSKISCWCIAAFAFPALAIAQQTARPDPADPRVSVPPVIYVSPLKQYQPLGDEQVTSWKAANELVEKIGGWKTYAKEAQATESPGQPIQPSAPQAKPPIQDGHSGHHVK